VYNATYNWYYGTDGKPPLLKKDLVTVAAHEIAHGLGFSGSARYEDGIGSYGFESNKRMAIYDTFMRNEGGNVVRVFYWTVLRVE
ncbi:MAG: hypothetical protein RQ728_10960, partial [Brevefilum sp.]|nr:hypothetical protein [Brevefilum sp.]